MIFRLISTRFCICGTSKLNGQVLTQSDFPFNFDVIFNFLYHSHDMILIRLLTMEIGCQSIYKQCYDSIFHDITLLCSHYMILVEGTSQCKIRWPLRTESYCYFVRSHLYKFENI